MIRSDIVRLLRAENPDLPTAAINDLLDAFFDSITQHLADGGRIELRGFGTFSTRSRDGRVARNPRTGKSVPVSPKRVPHFKPGKTMRERLAGTYSGSLETSLLKADGSDPRGSQPHGLTNRARNQNIKGTQESLTNERAAAEA